VSCGTTKAAAALLMLLHGHGLKPAAHERLGVRLERSQRLYKVLREPRPHHRRNAR